MTEKVKVSEIAAELGITSKDVLKKATDLGIEAKAANSSVTMEDADNLMKFIMGGETKTPAATKPKKTTTVKAEAKIDAPKEDVKEPSAEVEKKEETKTAEVTATEVKEPTSETPIVEAKIEKKPTGPRPVIVPVKKRSGLKIVKKKKPKVVESYDLPQKQASVSSYGKMSAEVLEELAQKKKNRGSSSTARKQEQGKRMDIFGGAMTDVSMDMDDQVTLLDLNSTERAPLPVEQPRKPRPPRPAGRNANKKQAPRGR